MWIRPRFLLNFRRRPWPSLWQDDNHDDEETDPMIHTGNRDATNRDTYTCRRLPWGRWMVCQWFECCGRSMLLMRTKSLGVFLFVYILPLTLLFTTAVWTLTTGEYTNGDSFSFLRRGTQLPPS